MFPTYIFAHNPDMHVIALANSDSLACLASGNVLLLVVSAWDCANKTGEKNDFTANVVVGRLGSGGFVVLDVWKSKLNFAQLPDVVLQRYALLIDRYKTLPVLAIEDSAAGTQLIDTIRSREPQIPLYLRSQ